MMLYSFAMIFLDPTVSNQKTQFPAKHSNTFTFPDFMGQEKDPFYVD
jgi:hypothetical protein